MAAKRIAMLVDNYFEESELSAPAKILAENNKITIISTNGKNLKAMKGPDQTSTEFIADLLLKDARSRDYDALILPGGIINADRLRANHQAQKWATDFLDSSRLVAATSYAPWLLVSADLVEEKRVTGSPTIKDDIKNAGGEWTDRSVVIEDNLITATGEKSIGKFIDSILEWFN